MFTTLAAMALAQAAAPATDSAAHTDNTVQPMPDYKQMRREIVANDTKLFWAMFEGCDPDSAAQLLHTDFRMIHDLGGLAAGSREAMLSQSREQCANRAPGGKYEGYRNRRLLTPGTRIVRPMGDWGALEEGVHTFYEWRGEEKGWVMTGGARYTHVWQWMPDEGGFRLLESISYDHGAAGPYHPDELEG